MNLNLNLSRTRSQLLQMSTSFDRVTMTFEEALTVVWDSVCIGLLDARKKANTVRAKALANLLTTLEEVYPKEIRRIVETQTGRRLHERRVSHTDEES